MTKPIEAFIKRHIKGDFDLTALPLDASFRKYYRVAVGEKSYIAMDASKEIESAKSFIKIGEYLYANKYSVPEIIEQDVELGFLLLEDLGQESYSKSLFTNKGLEFEKDLYKKAIDVLVALHNTDHDLHLNNYTKELLLDEVELFIDWYVESLIGEDFAIAVKDGYMKAWSEILDTLHYKHSCFTLRDYHVDNLMLMRDRSSIKVVGILDFQDAVKGSYAYDVVSLFEDARRDVSESVASDLLGYYLDNMLMIDRKKFLADYTILGVQRSCKIVGVFTRKAVRDNNHNYLVHLPRVWKYIKQSIQNPLLEPLHKWFTDAKIPVMGDVINHN